MYVNTWKTIQSASVAHFRNGRFRRIVCSARIDEYAYRDVCICVRVYTDIGCRGMWHTLRVWTLRRLGRCERGTVFNSRDIVSRRVRPIMGFVHPAPTFREMFSSIALPTGAMLYYACLNRSLQKRNDEISEGI